MIKKHDTRDVDLTYVSLGETIKYFIDLALEYGIDSMITYEYDDRYGSTLEIEYRENKND